MSSEFLPEDNSSAKRYPLWRDLSAGGGIASEDFVARAALHSGAERKPAEGLNQFHSEYTRETAPAKPAEAAERVGTPVLIPLPPTRRVLVTPRTVGIVAALFVVGFAAAVGFKQFQRSPAASTAYAPAAAARPVDTPAPTGPVDAAAADSHETVAFAEPETLPRGTSDSTAPAAVESPAAASTATALPAKPEPERLNPRDSRTTSAPPAAPAPLPERPPAQLTASARSAAAPAPSTPAPPVAAPDPAPVAVTRETPINAASTSGSVDVAVPAAVRNTPVATAGDITSAAAVPTTPERDLRPAPVDRPVPALSTAAPAPIASTVTPATAIERTLQGYQSAFSRLDVNAVRQVWPSVDQKALAKAFDQLRSEDLTLENCKVTVSGANAVAACGGKTEYVPKIGSKSPRVERHQWRISLQQVAERWVVRGVDVTAP